MYESKEKTGNQKVESRKPEDQKTKNQKPEDQKVEDREPIRPDTKSGQAGSSDTKSRRTVSPDTRGRKSESGKMGSKEPVKARTAGQNTGNPSRPDPKTQKINSSKDEDYEARLLRNYEQIVDALSKKKGLQVIADLASEILENPVSISDASTKILAVSKNYYTYVKAMKHMTELDQTTNVSLTKKQVSTGSMNFVRDSKRREYFFTNPSPHVVTKEELLDEGFEVHNGFLDCGVQVRGNVVAMISVADLMRPFRTEDMTYCSWLANIISIELQKSEIFAKNYGSDIEILLTDLLEERVEDNLQLMTRLQNIQKRLGKYLYVAVLSKKTAGPSDETLIPQILFSIVRSYFPGALSVIYKNGIVLLLQYSNEKKGTLKENKEFMILLEENNLRYGLSNLFYDLISMKKYYEQARKAIRLGTVMNPEKRVFVYYEYALIDAMDLSANKLSPRDLTHPLIAKLVMSKDPGDRELLKTLYVWLRCDRNTQKITEVMHIHRSTLYYRLNKMKEMLGSELDDGELIFQLMLSFKMIEYFTRYIDPSGESWMREIIDLGDQIQDV